MAWNPRKPKKSSKKAFLRPKEGYKFLRQFFKKFGRKKLEINKKYEKGVSHVFLAKKGNILFTFLRKPFFKSEKWAKNFEIFSKRPENVSTDLQTPFGHLETPLITRPGAGAFFHSRKMQGVTRRW